jgi:glucose-1-phosphate thymidylyltransferase
MAGIGKRMRPHSLSVPKPLIPVAGKPIVQRLVEGIAKSSMGKSIDEIAFVVGNFGDEVEKELVTIAEKLGAKGSIFYQNEPLGTAHAVWCAAEAMEGEVTIAFADTLFSLNNSIAPDGDAAIFVHEVEDPSAFGVVVLNENKKIVSFVEKPERFISNLAIIGIYYFKDAAILKAEIKYLLENNITRSGEFQITDALQRMLDKGLIFTPEKVDEWLDCGNKNATVYTNQRILEHLDEKELIHPTAVVEKTVIIPPCFLGENAVIRNAVIGPHVSIGHDSVIEQTIITNSIIQSGAVIKNSIIDNSMIGNYVEYIGTPNEVSIGDYTTFS